MNTEARTDTYINQYILIRGYKMPRVGKPKVKSAPKPTSMKKKRKAKKDGYTTGHNV